MIGNFLFDLKNEVWSQRRFDEDQIEICRMVSFLLRWHVVHVIVISFLEICLIHLRSLVASKQPLKL